MRTRLKNVPVQELLHPDDAKSLNKLDAVPGMKKLLTETISNLREKFAAVEMYGDGLNVNEYAYQELYALLKEATEILDMDKTPYFSLSWSYQISVGSEGAKNPRIMALSGAVDLLDDDELLFLLGHELGHILAGHKPYQNLLITFYTPLMNMVPNAQVWLGVLRPLLLQWYRNSDYTADRIGLLACQDINVAFRTMIKMSGLPKKYHQAINTDMLLKQAARFEQQNSGIAESIIENLSINTACVPWLVVRAAKLNEWYNSGEYDRILNTFAR